VRFNVHKWRTNLSHTRMMDIASPYDGSSRIASNFRAPLLIGPTRVRMPGPLKFRRSCSQLSTAASAYFRCFETSLVISNMFTVDLPPNTTFSGASALIIRLFFGSCSLFFLM
jgi:hypothetical protein